MTNSAAQCSSSHRAQASHLRSQGSSPALKWGKEPWERDCRRHCRGVKWCPLKPTEELHVFRTLKPVLCPPNSMVIVTYFACDPIITIITITVESIYSITAVSISRAVVVEAIIDICNEEKCSQYNKYAQNVKRYTLQVITFHICMKNDKFVFHMACTLKLTLHEHLRMHDCQIDHMTSLTL